MIFQRAKIAMPLVWPDWGMGQRCRFYYGWDYQRGTTNLFLHSGEQTRIRSAAASSMLGRHQSLAIRQTKRGYELISEGEREPVHCETWSRAERVLRRLGVPLHRIDEISSMLSEGKEIIVRRKI